MRRAFVVQLGPETDPPKGLFEGWVEEVDTCTELRFRSSQELLKFLGDRFKGAAVPRGEDQSRVPPVKKKARKD
jgi:hypothetical protein